MLERLDVINQRLLEHYGRFEDGRANWRVVFSNDEFEKRIVDCTPEGLSLAYPEVREVRKYPFDDGKYILERLIGIPDGALTDLTTRTSYEPVWTFQDKDGNALPPIWDAIYCIVHTVTHNLSRAGMGVPLKQPEGLGNTAEEIRDRVEKLEKELFEDETEITDALRYDSAVGYGTRKRNDWRN